MTTLLLLINLVASAVIWAAAMSFYLRRGAPLCARHHYSQIALVLVAVGAFAAIMTALKGRPVPWSEVALRMGFALLAAKTWLEIRGDRRRSPRA